VAGRLIREALALLALLATAGPAAAGGAGTCGRDLFMAEAALRQTADRLQRAGEAQGERCRVWRLHVETLRKVAGAYDRCVDGRERAEKAGSMRTMAGEFDGLIRERCR
jgi:hypothetical protein